MTPIPDEQLMARLTGGDEGALAELMQRWEGAVWCFIDRMCGAMGCTDDVYQEVWTRVFLYRRRYQPRRPFRPYLFSVAVNCCRTALRRGRFRPLSLDDAESGGDGRAVADDPPPIDRLIAAERQSQLHQAIARLPEAQRSVVLLHLLFDRNYKWIAKVLGLGAGTVRSHMHHALQNLRATLRKLTSQPEGQVDHERRPNRQTR